VELRAYLRQRERLLDTAASHIQQLLLSAKKRYLALAAHIPPGRSDDLSTVR